MKTQLPVYNSGTDTKGVTLRCGTTYTLDALERAGISYLPCTFDQPLVTYKHLWGKRQQVTLKRLFPKSAAWALKGMTGVQLITGEPTHRPSPTSPNGYIFLTDIDIESALFQRYPEIAEKVIALYSDAVEGEPCIIETKSGGRRLSAFCAYLDPKREFHDKTDGNQMLMEFFSLKGLSRIDERYAMLQGSLLDIPILEKRVLEEIYKIVSDVSTPKEQADRDTRVVEESQLGDLDIRWDADGKSQYFASEYCQATSHRSNRLTVQFSKWSGGVQGHCFNCGTSWWEVQPQRSIRKPVKLQKNVVSVLTETLDSSREFLKGVFADKKIRFFGLRADTGVGKSEGMIAFLMRGFSGILTVPTTDLAIELQARLDKVSEIESFRYRGILSNPDGAFPDETPCIQAVRYDAIASRGWNAYELLCESCEVREVCEDRGYRSQARNAKKAQVTVMPFPDIFLNPAFRTLAKEFVPTYHDDLIMHDEFDPYNAFLEINVPKSRLVQLRDDWDGYDPSVFAKEVLRILESEGDLSQLRALVHGVTPDVRQSVTEGLTCVMWRGQVLSREEAHRCDAFRASVATVDAIQGLPRLETEDWNLLVQLELFFERYGRDTDMPMKYENDTLTFLLPPLPMKTRARMGFMSAALQENLFRRTFSSRQEKRADVAFHDTGLTKWHPEARVYQLRTNRNPRVTVYAAKEERKEELLSSTGAHYWELVAAGSEK